MTTILILTLNKKRILKMISPADLAAAFLIGIGSSVHCMGMCGGIAASFAIGDQSRKFGSILLFNGGRLASYAFLGLIAGGLVSYLSPHLSSSQYLLRILAGAMLVAMGLYVSNWWRGLARLERLALPLWSRMQPLISKIRSSKSPKKSLYLGLAWGVLPCGLIYSTLIWAASFEAPIDAAALMLFMGMGTLPALMAISFTGVKLVRSEKFRQISGLMLIFYGIWTAVLPLQHLWQISGSTDTSMEMRH